MYVYGIYVCGVKVAETFRFLHIFLCDLRTYFIRFQVLYNYINNNNNNENNNDNNNNNYYYNCNNIFNG